MADFDHPVLVPPLLRVLFTNKKEYPGHYAPEIFFVVFLVV
jgi:hypothetical protein